MNQISTMNALIILTVFLLLVVLGIVSFHYYSFVSAKNGITAGAGGSISIFGNRREEPTGFSSTF